MTLPVWPAEPELDDAPPAPPFLVEVEFKGNRRAFFRCDFESMPLMGAAVIVDVDRGEDLGRINATGELAFKRSAGLPHGVGTTIPQQRILRLATPAEIARERALRAEDETARRAAAEKVRAANLDLKLSDAEWQFDRKKLTFYFTAEKRIDFRALVRDLASQFRARIELKQYGVRDEARRLSGIGRCGREYCSSAFLTELRPVNLGVAKEQKLSLNPSQISGACGRLMCCLRYEHDFYAAARKRFPKEGKILVTERGEEKVVSVDIFRDRVTLRSVEGEVRIAELAELTGAAPAPVEPVPSSNQTNDDESGDAERDANTDEPRTEPRTEPRAEPRAEKREKREERPAQHLPPQASDAPAEAPPAAPAAPALDAISTDPDDEGDDLDDPDDATGAADATATDGTSAAPRRRRRGRRGGRRGRGPGGAGDAGSSSSNGPTSS